MQMSSSDFISRSRVRSRTTRVPPNTVPPPCPTAKWIQSSGSFIQPQAESGASSATCR